MSSPRSESEGRFSRISGVAPSKPFFGGKLSGSRCTATNSTQTYRFTTPADVRYLLDTELQSKDKAEKSWQTCCHALNLQTARYNIR